MISTIRIYFTSQEDSIAIETGILEFIMRIDNFLEDNFPLGTQIMSGSESDGSESDGSESDGSESDGSESDGTSSSDEKEYITPTNYSYRSQLRWIRIEEKAYRHKFLEKNISWRPTHSKCR
jgi:hypothetical protein